MRVCARAPLDRSLDKDVMTGAAGGAGWIENPSVIKPQQRLLPRPRVMAFPLPSLNVEVPLIFHIFVE